MSKTKQIDNLSDKLEEQKYQTRISYKQIFVNI